MGLEMNAYKKFYVRNYNHQSPEERYEVRVTRGGKPVTGIKTDGITSLKEQTKYWCKANHIHGWFVDNVQCGKDDCHGYIVHREQLKELHDTCDQVIAASKLVDGMVYTGTVYDKDHPHGVAQRAPGKVIEDPTVAKKLLPTRSGFIFGCVDYDERYLKMTIETRDWAAQMLADSESDVPFDHYYGAGW